MNYFNNLLQKEKRILIFGKNGQLGKTFQNAFGNHENILQLGGSNLNFLEHNLIPYTINEFKPDIVINTSAYTDVSKAEKNQNDAFTINSDAVKVIANASKSNGSLLVHYSTDYVFDGKQIGMYSPKDEPNPVNIYGKSKLLGEQNILKSGCNFLIFRISWLMSSHGVNFIKKIIAKIRNNEDISIVDDQIGTPISCDLVSKITAEILLLNRKEKQRKIYHLSTKGKVSWYDIAIFIAQNISDINLKIKIKPIKSNYYQSIVKRPHNSLFDHSEIERILDKKMPCWKDDIRPIISQICS